MIEATLRIDPVDRIATVDPRVFGSFVEHMGRCVYEGVHEPGSPFADDDGDRADVIALTRELGPTVIRYPGGNFVSSYRWEDGIGPAEARPVRLDPAWRSIETNRFGLHEFIRWAGKVGVEPMMAVNLGTRGLSEACDLLEYANHPSGTALSDQRRANGAAEPFGIRTWCLGNEMDGPWQTGHKTADVYGRLAAETAKAMRQIDPGIELVACGSSHAEMPTFGDWEATVLAHTFDHVDYISLHAYYEPLGGDLASFLASGHGMDRFIEGVVATADFVAAKKRSRRRINLSFDEWNVWYQQDFAGHTNLEWANAPHLIEDSYTGLDAVVVGDLLMSLLRHADRVKLACLAQLVNIIAPIRTEPGVPAWRQTIFHPFALTARYGRGDVVRSTLRGPRHETERHGPVDTVDTVALIDDTDAAITVLAVNRQLEDPAELSLDIVGADYVVAEIHRIGGPQDQGRANVAGGSNTVTPRVVRPDPGSSEPSVTMEPVSWNLIRLTRRTD